MNKKQQRTVIKYSLFPETVVQTGIGEIFSTTNSINPEVTKVFYGLFNINGIYFKQ